MNKENKDNFDDGCRDQEGNTCKYYKETTTIKTTNKPTSRKQLISSSTLFLQIPSSRDQGDMIKKHRGGAPVPATAPPEPSRKR